MTKGPILIIEDDVDDQEMYTEAIRVLNISNELRYFSNGKDALHYLLTTEEQPFVIISDINMPGMNGLELRKQIQDDPYLCTKGIPYIFISTNASKVSVRHAHALSVQGYFEKPNSLHEMIEMFRALFAYWERCKHINNT